MGSSPEAEAVPTSWRGRIARSAIRILVGILLIPIGIILLCRNEDLAAIATIAFDHGFHQTVEADPNSVLPSNDGRLIHLTGEIKTAASALDSAFQVTGSGLLRLHRKVEMFQWEEDADGTTQPSTVGSGTQTSYAYHSVWSESAINSGTFRQPAGHVNPVLPMKSVTFDSSAPVLGVYHIDSAVIHQISDFTPLAVMKAPPTPPYPSPFFPARPYHLERGSFYIGWNPTNPAIGDVRVTFEAVPAQVFSLVGAQAGATLTPYHLTNGRQIIIIEPGKLSATALFAEAKPEERKIITWILCTIGFLVMATGVALMSAPAGKLFPLFPSPRGLSKRIVS